MERDVLGRGKGRGATPTQHKEADVAAGGIVQYYAESEDEQDDCDLDAMYAFDEYVFNRGESGDEQVPVLKAVENTFYLSCERCRR